MNSIRAKLLSMMAIIAVGAILSAALGLFALQRSSSLNQRSSTQGDIALTTERINGRVIAVVMDARGIYMSKTAKEAEPFAKGMEASFATLKSLTAELNRLLPEEGRERGQQIAKAIQDFIAFRSETIRLGREVSIEAANAQGNNDLNRANRKALNDLLVDFGKRNEEAGNALAAEADTFTNMVNWLLPLVLLVGLAGSFLIALLFGQRLIARPILDLGAVMKRLTAGETDIAVPHTGRTDEIGEMARAVSVLRESTEQVRALEEQERAAAQRRLQAADSMASIVSDVGEVVAAAAAGDFSARLQIGDADPQMQKLVAGINEINAVVDSATTEFAQSLQAVAGGDLTHRIDTAYRGRFADLKGA
ncbi:HAMP domain-containing protein, partial [Bosea sp. Leaf344]|uniref:HAMP domain-containing protein n=1 Tax=Bosea sp. Leaf344 TaxID=1736346 RepID=UPI000AD54520